MPDLAKIRECFRATFRSLVSRFTFFIWLACIVVATIAGPFGTYSAMTGPVRLAYWVAVVTGAILSGYTARAITGALIDRGKPVIFDIVVIGITTAVFTPIVWVITHHTKIRIDVQMPSFAVFAAYVMICTAVVFIVRRVTPGFESTSYQFLGGANYRGLAIGTKNRRPRLARRLSAENRGRILRLTANDHFVEVATDNGTQALRLRFSDAIEEMDPIAGYCIHRSHWVTHDAIVECRHEPPQKLFVILRNGDQIPVSRKYRNNLVEAGFL